MSERYRHRSFFFYGTLIDPDVRRLVLGDAVAEAEAQLPPFDPGTIDFDRVSFFLSTLSSSQPVYPRERTVPLE